jgi:hypothetical protein
MDQQESTEQTNDINSLSLDDNLLQEEYVAKIDKLMTSTKKQESLIEKLK